MNLSIDYNKYKKNLFFFDSEYLQNLRQDLINNFNLNSNVIKSNESLKHFDTKILNNFIYNPVDESDLFPSTIKNYLAS